MSDIVTIPFESIRLIDFYEKFVFPGVPVVLTGTPSPLCDSAEAARKDGALVNWLERTFSDCQVPLVDSEGTMEIFTLSDWRNEARKRYLKDWHVFEENISLFKPPSLFEEDWLNGFLVENGFSDYRFLYWGDAGSETNLHEDVMKSFSWSLNLNGRKEWKFIGSDDVVQIVMQQPMDAIFVPSGMKHSVKNLDDDTISINHNWANAANIRTIWTFIQEERRNFQHELTGFGAINICEQGTDSIETMMKLGSGMTIRNLAGLIQWGLHLNSSSTSSLKENRLWQEALKDAQQILNEIMSDAELCRLTE